MEITHVIRAEEWIASTPLHMLLYDELLDLLLEVRKETDR